MLLTEVSEDDLLNMVEKKAPEKEIVKEEPQKEEPKPVKKAQLKKAVQVSLTTLVVLGKISATLFCSH